MNKLDHSEPKHFVSRKLHSEGEDKSQTRMPCFQFTLTKYRYGFISIMYKVSTN